ncbi:MAG: hypothetical protein QW589_01145 [Candidatus Bathyarchaeia archaeon]
MLWQPYANGKGEWIKADLAEVQELREKLSEMPGFMLKIGDYQYRLVIGFNSFLEGG